MIEARAYWATSPLAVESVSASSPDEATAIELATRKFLRTVGAKRGERWPAHIVILHENRVLKFVPGDPKWRRR